MTRTSWCRQSLGLVCALVLGMASAVPLVAQEVSVPVRLQIPLLANVLSFERTLRERVESEILVMVAYQSEYGPSRDFKDEVARHVSGEALSIHGKRLRWTFFDLTSHGALTREISTGGASVVFVGPLRAIDFERMAAFLATEKVILISGVADYAYDGAVVSFALQGGRPTILLNRRAASATGVDFSAQLLHLADFVR